MWEYVTYGSGSLYHGVFSAVALMSGANAVDSLIRLALVLGVAMCLVKAVTDFNIGAILRWYIFAVVIYGVLWVPKVSIQVNDRLNPGHVHAIVANVPLGVGASSALVSQIGDRIIKLTETSFGDPADGEYSRHGMIFGAKMFAKINALRPSDQRLALNLRDYFHNCGLYDIADNTVSIDTLSKSPDMWATLTASPNPARMGQYTYEDGTTALKACNDFVTLLNADVATDLPKVQKYLMASLDPEGAEASMNAKQLAVSNVVTTAVGSSQDATAIIKQSVMRNMLNDSLKGYMGTSSGVLGATMAELQTHNTQKLLGVIAEKAVVNLKIVIELLFIGIFPVLFPIFLLPKIGPTMAKGYLAGFFYLQLWGPMYVVLHKIMMANAYAHTASATFNAGGTHVFSALTLDAAALANQDVCTLAGSMMLMIPVLAGLLTKGAMAVGAQGEALLGNFRSGAESASNSMTSGNWSLGNSAVGNHSWSNDNANQHVTSRYEDRNRQTVVGADGVTMASYNGGLMTATGALSSGALDLSRQEGYSQSLSRTSQSYLDQSRSLTEAAIVGRTRSRTVMDEVFKGWSSNSVNFSGMSKEEQASTGRVISDLQSLSNYYQTSKGMTKSEADANATKAGVTAYAQAEAGFSTPPGTAFSASAKAGVKGEASKEASTTATQTKSNDRGFSIMNSLSTEVSDTHNRISTDAARSAFDRSFTKDNGARHVTSNSFSTMQSITDTATKLQATGSRLSEDATNVRNGNETVTGNEGTAFFNWMIRDKGISVSEARALWVGANQADLHRGMALAQEYNGLQADSLGAKYFSAETPDAIGDAVPSHLSRADASTGAVRNDSGLLPAASQSSSPTAHPKAKAKAKPKPDPTHSSGSDQGWGSVKTPNLQGSSQATAFEDRNTRAATTSDGIKGEVEGARQDLGTQEVREEIKITDQFGEAAGKVANASVKAVKRVRRGPSR